MIVFIVVVIGLILAFISFKLYAKKKFASRDFQNSYKKTLFRLLVKKKLNDFEKINASRQENKIKEANSTLNKYLLEFSEKPSEELGNNIFNILGQNQSYIILTFSDNNDPNDNKTFNLTNSINFRKIKNGNIGAFTEFGVMRDYVSNYISTEIILIGDFIKFCNEYDIKSITLNFTLAHPYILTID